MKMVSHILGESAGIAIYPTISLLLFFSIFIGIIVWIMREDSERMKMFGNLPLEDDILKNMEHEEINNQAQTNA